jgi:hypothetical protein
MRTKEARMKTKEEGLLATLAVLGIAALVAYLFPDHSLPAAGPRASSDSAMPPGKTLEPGRGRHAVSPDWHSGKGLERYPLADLSSGRGATSLLAGIEPSCCVPLCAMFAISTGGPLRNASVAPNGCSQPSGI